MSPAQMVSFVESILAKSKKRRKQLLLPPVQLNVPQQSVPHSVHLGLQPVFLLLSSCSLAGGVEGDCVEISML